MTRLARNYGSICSRGAPPKEQAAGAGPAAAYENSSLARRLARGEVIDSLFVQCSNSGCVDLAYSGGEGAVKATLPEVSYQITAFKREADLLGSTPQSRIEHFGALVGINIQVTIEDDFC